MEMYVVESSAGRSKSVLAFCWMREMEWAILPCASVLLLVGSSTRVLSCLDTRRNCWMSTADRDPQIRISISLGRSSSCKGLEAMVVSCEEGDRGVDGSSAEMSWWKVLEAMVVICAEGSRCVDGSLAEISWWKGLGRGMDDCG